MGGLQCENLQRGMNITLLGREANLILLRLFGWGDKTFFFLQGGKPARQGDPVHLCPAVTHSHLFNRKIHRLYFLLLTATIMTTTKTDFL